MRKIILLFLTIISFKLIAQEVNIIPQPVSIKTGKNTDKFIIDQNTEIISNDSLSNSALFLQNYIQQYYNIKLQINPNSTNKKNIIKLEIISRVLKNLNEYELISNNNQTIVYACSENGLFYGIQSLIQLLPTSKSTGLNIPAVEITDYPRFDYRGMHLDVSRHFFDVAFVKQYIDYLALHKMNYFHWHLTDDHGWRIEIKKYPKLTEIGAWRNGSIIGLWPGKGNENIKYQVLPTEVKITPKDALLKTDGIKHGGYYTQEQIKEVVDYAAKRYITIIPEIEIPAHSMDLLAAYPE